MDNAHIPVETTPLLPGDVVVIRYRASLSEGQAGAIHDRAQAVMPPGVRVLVLESGASLAVLTGEGLAEDPADEPAGPRPNFI